jgi:hypothetical protein
VNSEDDPQMTVGVVIDVIAQPCRGAHPRGKLIYPPVPADALRSRLSTETITCHVRVDSAGHPAADCSGNAADLPSFLLARAREIIEKADWMPATIEQGQPCDEEVDVLFRWRNPASRDLL